MSQHDEIINDNDIYDLIEIDIEQLIVDDDDVHDYVDIDEVDDTEVDVLLLDVNDIIDIHE